MCFKGKQFYDKNKIEYDKVVFTKKDKQLLEELRVLGQSKIESSEGI